MNDLSVLRSLLLCACPAPTEITDIPASDCLESLGQVQRVGFQRTLDGTTLNEITIGVNDPALLATWTTLKAAADDTKVQFTPKFANPVNEAGAIREFGTGNQVLDGIPINIGRDRSPFTAEFYNIKQAIITALKDYECEPELAVFLITENKKIWGLADDVASPTTFRGIPIYQFFVSDKQLGGYEEPDRNFIQWSFTANWSDNLYAVTPSDFDPLLEL